LSRVYIGKLFRKSRGNEFDKDLLSFGLSKGQAALIGLNEFK